MTVGEFLAQTTTTLHDAGIATARLDSLVLLEDALHQDRAILLAHPEREIPVPILAKLYKRVIQRADHIPLAYIRGHVSFYGRDFLVNEHVLVPRPETEAMIDILLSVPNMPPKPRIADVGTGSGCIGITAALSLPTSAVTLYDVDSKALGIAAQNATALRASVLTAQQDLLTGCTQEFDVVMANLPYVPEKYPINRAAKHEPALALFAGADGLDLYRRFWQQLAALLYRPAYVLTEALLAQHPGLAALATAAGYKQVQQKGLIQLFAR